MTQPVTLPLWLVLLLALLALWALLQQMLLPGARFFLRRRLNRAVDRLNRRLQIKIQPFKLTRRQVLVERLLYDPQVMEAAEAFGREREMPREVVMERVERYAREIVPHFNAMAYYQLAYRLARRVARLLYRVRLGYADEEALAAIAPRSTVVFLMNHRSNMDYVLVSYMVADRSALSYAVGEWARVWPLDTLIRAMGAYFVRRRSRDDLYRRVLQRYVQMATAGGVTQAVYPEGGLSRDGRLGAPKLGLLDYMLRDFDPEGERDLVFVPVGLNYDRTLEDRTLLRDADPAAGQPRPGFGAALATTARFVVRHLLLMARQRWHRFGYACVNFGAPISMRAHLARRGLDLRRLEREERFARVAEIATELMAAIAAVVPVLPVSLVATVFLEEMAASGAPLSELEIKARAHRLMEELEAAGARVYVPRADQDYAITVGLRMLTLRRLVVEEGGLFTSRRDERALLAYYANAIAHLRAPLIP